MDIFKNVQNGNFQNTFSNNFLRGSRTALLNNQFYYNVYTGCYHVSSEFDYLLYK